jgi:nicotinate-nucleotide adenylyltransferase
VTQAATRAARAEGPEAAPLPAAEHEISQPRRLGVLGGTFDPPHLGHLWLAALAADELALDRVLFMPAARPPHKRGRRISPTSDRLVMTRLAITGNPAFELCPLEIERPGPSFTVDSVRELRRLHPDARLFLVMAADSLEQIHTWRDPQLLLSLVEWAVGPRRGFELPDRALLRERFGAHAARIHLLSGPALEVSASAIRRRVAEGRTIRYLVPRAVEDHISDRSLYRAR